MGKAVKTPKVFDRVPAKLTVYKWGGRKWPFKVKIPCGECTLTQDIIEDVLKNELVNAEVDLDVKDWLSHLFQAVSKGARHAPAILLDGKVISQGAAVNRGLLSQKIMERHIQHFPIEGTHVFGKEGCPFCVKAKEAMANAGITYTYHDVVKNPGAMYEMIARTKRIIGPKTPVTVPQIWIDGEYIGGYDQLAARLENSPIEKNAESYWPGKISPPNLAGQLYAVG